MGFWSCVGSGLVGEGVFVPEFFLSSGVGGGVWSMCTRGCASLFFFVAGTKSFSVWVVVIMYCCFCFFLGINTIILLKSCCGW